MPVLQAIPTRISNDTPANADRELTGMTSRCARIFCEVMVPVVVWCLLLLLPLLLLLLLLLLLVLPVASSPVAVARVATAAALAP